jgi:hypothetical protein
VVLYAAKRRLWSIVYLYPLLSASVVVHAYQVYMHSGLQHLLLASCVSSVSCMSRMSCLASHAVTSRMLRLLILLILLQ